MYVIYRLICQGKKHDKVFYIKNNCGKIAEQKCNH